MRIRVGGGRLVRGGISGGRGGMRWNAGVGPVGISGGGRRGGRQSSGLVDAVADLIPAEVYAALFIGGLVVAALLWMWSQRFAFIIFFGFVALAVCCAACVAAVGASRTGADNVWLLELAGAGAAAVLLVLLLLTVPLRMAVDGKQEAECARLKKIAGDDYGMVGWGGPTPDAEAAQEVCEGNDPFKEHTATIALWTLAGFASVALVAVPTSRALSRRRTAPAAGTSSQGNSASAGPASSPNTPADFPLPEPMPGDWAGADPTDDEVAGQELAESGAWEEFHYRELATEQAKEEAERLEELRAVADDWLDSVTPVERDPDLPPAGFYTDPSGEHLQRWWSGKRWTDTVRDSK